MCRGRDCPGTTLSGSESPDLPEHFKYFFKTINAFIMSRRLVFSVFALFMSVMCFAQAGSIRGTVYSESDREPLAGAAVIVEGTRLGVQTDTEGHFLLTQVPQGAQYLEVSFLGMQTSRVRISGPDMTIFLQEDGTHLDEVFVVAYGTARKSSYSGSASVVGGDAIRDIPGSGFENALAGRVAGMQVTSSSGQAGSVPEIRIRGIGSMNASNEPLYVIDGVPVGSGDAGQMSSYTYSTSNLLSTLNPEDIESISVLKDAAASSLYGSRAANGVVIITTRTGKEGRPVVRFKASVGFTPTWATNNYEAASVQEQVNMLYTVFHDYATTGQGKSEAAASDAAISRLNSKFNRHGYTFKAQGTDAYANVEILEYDGSGRQGRYFDWNDAYFRTAVYQSYDLSVSGASNGTSYFASLSYTDDQGRLRVNSFDRYSGRVNLNQKVGRLFELGTNVSIGRTGKSGYNDTRNTGSNSFMQTRNLLWGLYWPTDYKTGEPWTARYGSYAQNGVYYDTQWSNEATTTDASITETAVVHFFPGLDLKSVLSYDHKAVSESLYYSADHFNAASVGGRIHEMRTIYETLVSSTTLNFDRTFGLNHIGLMAGFEAEKAQTNFTRTTGENLPTSTLHTVATAGTISGNGYSWGHSMVSVLAKADYDWDGRYYLSASWRRDGSSKLSPQTRWGNFWSVSGAWNLTREAFLQNVRGLDLLRLRASYGINGTLPTDNYGYMNLMSYRSAYMGNPGGTVISPVNDSLTWETNATVNVGVDFTLWSGRLSGTVEYFSRNSENLLQDVPISMVTGFSSSLMNVGRINNSGWEIDLSGVIIRRRGLVWSASANVALLNSRVVSLSEGKDIIWYDPTGSDDRAQFLYREGGSTLDFYGYEWAGVNPENGKSVYYTHNDTEDFVFNGRSATYDYRKADYTVIGSAIPRASGGFSTRLSVGGFDLGADFVYKIGGSLYDGAYKDVADDGYYWERIRARSYYEQMWTPDRRDGTQPALSGMDLEDSMQYTSRHLHDASFLRLKTLSAGYTLPASLTRRAFISRARIFGNISNLLTLSSYKEADPEVNVYGTRGWETPLGKTYVIGVELQF